MPDLSEPFVVPGIGTVYFRRLEPVELHRIMMGLAGDRKHSWRLWPIMVAAAACEANGDRIFDMDDVPKLEKLPSYAVEPMGRAAAKFNGIKA